MNGPLAIFDCDGTLVDSQASICEAMERAYAAAALPAPDRHAVRRAVGLSLPQTVDRLLPEYPEAVRDAVADNYRREFRALRESGALAEPLYDGIADLIRKLHSDGWLLGVATGKSKRGLDHCLAHHGLTRYFSTLQTADFHPSKPHPAMIVAALDETLADPAQTVMIGDTAYDMAMAVSAGVRPIGVDWGYHDTHELVAAGAGIVAKTVAELAELLERT